MTGCSAKRGCIALAVVGLVLGACSRERGAGQQNPVDSAVMAARVAELETTVAKLEGDVSTLQIAVANDRLSRVDYGTAEFDPSDSSFLRVDSSTSFGSFAVSIQDVRPFGDGVRVKLHVGNPSSATFADAKLSFRYGSRSPEDLTDLSKRLEWRKTLREKEMTLTEPLRAATWNPVSVTLPSIAADHFGYLSVAISTNQIALAQK